MTEVVGRIVTLTIAGRISGLPGESAAQVARRTLDLDADVSDADALRALLTQTDLPSAFVRVAPTDGSFNLLKLAPVPEQTFIGDGLQTTFTHTLTSGGTGLGIFARVDGVIASDYRQFRWPDGVQMLDGDLPTGTVIQFAFGLSGLTAGHWSVLSPAKPLPAPEPADTLTPFFARGAAARAIQKGFEA